MLVAVPPTALEAFVLSLPLAVMPEAFPPQWLDPHDLEQECVDIPERRVGTCKRPNMEYNRTLLHFLTL